MRAMSDAARFPWSPPRLDAAALAGAAARQAVLTRPPGSLGMLEPLALQLAALQGRVLPVARPAAALLFAADHPVTRHRVSAYPAEVTAAMLANFAAGGAAASVLARLHRIPLRVIDVGVARAAGGVARAAGGAASGPHAGAEVMRRPVADSEAGDLLHTDAMLPEVYAAALRTGADESAALGSGLRVLLLGEMGIGNSTAAAAVYAALLGGDPGEYAGPGTGVHGEALAHKREVLRGAVERVRRAHPGLQDDPHRALQTLGGREIAAIAGAMAEAIARGVAVLVDGFIVGAAALALVRLDPAWRAGMIFAHRSAEPAHARVLAAIGAVPLLDLGMRLGETSGALTAFPLVEAACALHNEMATFAEAGVPDREDAGV